MHLYDYPSVARTLEDDEAMVSDEAMAAWETADYPPGLNIFREDVWPLARTAGYYWPSSKAEARDKDREPGVYFITGADKVKIGTSQTHANRLRDLQAASPVSLKLYRFVPCAPGRGGTVERELHRQFAAVRAHGEWFETAVVTRVIDQLTDAEIQALVHCRTRTPEEQRERDAERQRDQDEQLRKALERQRRRPLSWKAVRAAENAAVRRQDLQEEAERFQQWEVEDAEGLAHFRAFRDYEAATLHGTSYDRSQVTPRLYTAYLATTSERVKAVLRAGHRPGGLEPTDCYLCLVGRRAEERLGEPPPIPYTPTKHRQDIDRRADAMMRDRLRRPTFGPTRAPVADS